MENLLDIITITKDDIEGLTRTIQSTRQLRINSGLRQIVVDGSGEECREKILNLLNTETSIDYVWKKPSGIGSAFNCGLDLAKSRWVWFLNSGDEVHPDMEFDKFLYIVRKSSADIIIFQQEVMPDGEINQHPPLWDRWPGLFTWIPHQASLTRKSLYEQYGKFDESFKIATDYEFWIRCLSKNIIVDTISIPLARFNIDGVSRTRIKEVFRENIRFINIHLKTIIKVWILNGINILKAWTYYLKSSDNMSKAKSIFFPIAKFIFILLYVSVNGTIRISLSRGRIKL